MGYIYLIENDINNKLYIGQTIKTVRYRFNQHMNAALRGETYCLIYDDVRIYGRDKYHYKQLEKVNNEKLYEREEYWIRKYNTIDPNGYNQRYGGNDYGQRAVYKIDKDTNEILEYYASAKEAAIENGCDLSALTKVCRHQKDAKSLLNFKWSYVDNYNSNLINSLKIHETRYGINQMDINTNKLIKRWDSIAQASNELNIDQTSISHCLRGRYQKAGGYGWIKDDDVNTYKYVKGGKKIRKIAEIDSCSNVIKIWDSAIDAEKELNISANTIRAVCRGSRQSIKGHRFIYYKEDIQNAR